EAVTLVTPACPDKCPLWCFVSRKQGSPRHFPYESDEKLVPADVKTLLFAAVDCHTDDCDCRRDGQGGQTARVLLDGVVCFALLPGFRRCRTSELLDTLVFALADVK
ncbi:unnamed protein product, partial [Scytosiphon promiscuus]